MHKNNGNSSEIHWPWNVEAQCTAKIEPKIWLVRRKDSSTSLTLRVCVAKTFFFISTLRLHFDIQKNFVFNLTPKLWSLNSSPLTPSTQPLWHLCYILLCHDFLMAKLLFSKAAFIFYPTKSFHFTLLHALDASLAQVFLKEVPQSTWEVTAQLRCANTTLAEAVVSLLPLQTFLFHSSMFEISCSFRF